MPVFEIQGPDGKTYEVDAPDQNSALSAFQSFASGRADPATNQPPMPTTAPQQEDRGFFRRLDDAVRGAADVLTLGTADEIAAKLGDWTGIGGEAGNYDANLAAQRERDANGRLERLGGQVAGAFLVPGTAARSTLGAVGKGAAIGGAYGFGSGEGGVVDRAKSGGIGMMVGGAASGTVHKIADAIMGKVAKASIPDAASLRSISQAGYDAADAAGVIVGPHGVRNLATETVNDLTSFGYHPQLQPRIGAILGEMERLGNTNTTYKGLDTLRKIAGQVANSNDPAEKAMATRIMSRLDDYMTNLPADDVIMGDAAAASAGIKQGRDNWARMRRAEMVDTAAIKAKRRADTSGTGGNLDNTLRQNVRAILDNPKRSRGMTPAELEMAERIVSGSGGQNALRLLGRLSPTTGGLSAAMNVGATALNPLMAIPGAIGLGAKALADRTTVRNVEKLAEMIRSGGQTSKQIANQAIKGIGQKELVDAIMRIRNAEGRLGPAAARIAVGLKDYAGY